MAEIVNLRQAKKTRARDKAKAQADANAVKFGRSKAERSLDAARAEKDRAHLESHLIDKPVK